MIIQSLNNNQIFLDNDLVCLDNVNLSKWCINNYLLCSLYNIDHYIYERTTNNGIILPFDYDLTSSKLDIDFYVSILNYQHILLPDDSSQAILNDQQFLNKDMLLSIYSLFHKASSIHICITYSLLKINLSSNNHPGFYIQILLHNDLIPTIINNDLCVINNQSIDKVGLLVIAVVGLLVEDLYFLVKDLLVLDVIDQLFLVLVPLHDSTRLFRCNNEFSS